MKIQEIIRLFHLKIATLALLGLGTAAVKMAMDAEESELHILVNKRAERFHIVRMT